MIDESEPLTLADARALLERIASLEDQLKPKASTDTKLIDINDVRVPPPREKDGSPLKFPTTVYRAQDPIKHGQRDHPGFDAKVIKTAESLARHLAEGWHATMEEAEQAGPVAEPEKKPRGRKAVA